MKGKHRPPVAPISAPRQNLSLPKPQGETVMKGNEKVIALLNNLLADELTTISEYMVHSEMCDSWGYAALHQAAEKRAIDEMKHAEKLIGRILFLEGTPVVSQFHEMHIGANVEAQLRNDLASEVGAVKAYNDGLGLTAEAGDGGTHDLLQSILKDEEAHLDWLEAQRDQIEQMGIQIYLSRQLG
jgi:bacterioferritin